MFALNPLGVAASLYSSKTAVFPSYYTRVIMVANFARLAACRIAGEPLMR